MSSKPPQSGSTGDSPKETARLLAANIAQARATFDALAQLAAPVAMAVETLHACLASGGKILACGNGGSACDSAHFVAEIVGRYVRERRGYPAIDLTADHGLITALINDYPPQRLFARQIEALGKPGDALVVFTSSGNSPNIVEALAAARAGGLRTIAFHGRDGGACRGGAEIELIVPGQVTARIQEGHQLLLHTVCEALDARL
ncbi:MAG: SIS domain-containing protein [Planctomycetota bacterium]|nr:SIS domain-containing protein [Planctomycetota bacterium]